MKPEPTDDRPPPPAALDTWLRSALEPDRPTIERVVTAARREALPRRAPRPLRRLGPAVLTAALGALALAIGGGLWLLPRASTPYLGRVAPSATSAAAEGTWLVGSGGAVELRHPVATTAATGLPTASAAEPPIYALIMLRGETP